MKNQFNMLIIGESETLKNQYASILTVVVKASGCDFSSIKFEGLEKEELDFRRQLSVNL